MENRFFIEEEHFEWLSKNLRAQIFVLLYIRLVFHLEIINRNKVNRKNIVGYFYPPEYSEITIDRNGVLKDLTLVPKNIDGKGTIGAQLQPNIKRETKKTKSIFELFKYTNNEFLSLLVKTIQGYKT